MNVCMLALMAMIPSHSVPITGEPCASSGYTRAWNQLFVKTGVAKHDTRYGLHEASANLPLSSEESDWLSHVTGNIICPGDRKILKGNQGSAAVIGRNDMIVTSAHNVRTKDGKARDDWPKCYFESQSIPPVRRGLKFFDPGTVFGTRQPEDERGLDFVAIRLDKPIQGIEPIPISFDVQDLKKNQQIYVVSAYQDGMPADRKVIGNEPIFQTCAVQEVHPAGEQGGLSIYSDCSGTAGASGSITLKRDDSGKLVGIGMVSRTTSRSLDGQAYDGTPNVGNHTYQLMFDGPFARGLQTSLGIQSGL